MSSLTRGPSRDGIWAGMGPLAMGASPWLLGRTGIVWDDGGAAATAVIACVLAGGRAGAA